MQMPTAVCERRTSREPRRRSLASADRFAGRPRDIARIRAQFAMLAPTAATYGSFGGVHRDAPRRHSLMITMNGRRGKPVMLLCRHLVADAAPVFPTNGDRVNITRPASLRSLRRSRKRARLTSRPAHPLQACTLRGSGWQDDTLVPLRRVRVSLGCTLLAPASCERGPLRPPTQARLPPVPAERLPVGLAPGDVTTCCAPAANPAERGATGCERAAK